MIRNRKFIIGLAVATLFNISVLMQKETIATATTFDLSTNQLIYSVKSGDTLAAICKKFSVDMNTVISVNNISSPNLLKIGQKITIPGNNEDIANQISKNTSSKMIIPSNGTLSSNFGTRWGRQHNGIDIASPLGTDVYASMGGKVIFSGWDSGGYGYLVIIDHGNGLQTYYAHNSELLVKKDQTIEQGAIIAKVGSTGNSTGPHSHFEVRKDDIPVNPYTYL